MLLAFSLSSADLHADTQLFFFSSSNLVLRIPLPAIVHQTPARRRRRLPEERMRLIPSWPTKWPTTAATAENREARNVARASEKETRNPRIPAAFRRRGRRLARRRRLTPHRIREEGEEANAEHRRRGFPGPSTGNTKSSGCIRTNPGVDVVWPLSRMLFLAPSLETRRRRLAAAGGGGFLYLVCGCEGTRSARSLSSELLGG